MSGNISLILLLATCAVLAGLFAIVYVFPRKPRKRVSPEEGEFSSEISRSTKA